MTTGQETSYARSSAPVIAGFASTSQALMDRIVSVGAAKAIDETMKGLDVRRLAQSIKLDMPKMPVSNISHNGGAARVHNENAPSSGIREV